MSLQIAQKNLVEVAVEAEASLESQQHFCRDRRRSPSRRSAEVFHFRPSGLGLLPSAELLKGGEAQLREGDAGAPRLGAGARTAGHCRNSLYCRADY